MYLLCTAGRFTEALQMAQAGRQAARALDAPPALTSVLDNNTVAVLTATGRWPEAGHLLAELAGESAAYVQYLTCCGLELAVGQGDDQQAKPSPPAWRRRPKTPADRPAAGLPG